MKKSISMILVLLSVLCCTVPAFAQDTPAPDDFIPVIRFIAASDSHLWDKNDEINPRIGLALENTYTHSGV